MISFTLSSAITRRRSLTRLRWLFELEERVESENQTESRDRIDLTDSLSKAGFLSTYSRKRVLWVKYCLILLGAVLGAVLGFITKTPYYLCTPAGIYLGGLSWFIYLKLETCRTERRNTLELPIILESLILLVDSGLALLPALEKVVEKQETNLTLVRYLFKLVHELSMRGLPLGEALKHVSEQCDDNRALRHVFLHLDISGNEGGSLIPALRSLAQFAHSEWRLAVETRVRRLENLVVFPVFGAVIGLVLLSASVPIVPLLELKERLDAESVELARQ